MSPREGAGGCAIGCRAVLILPPFPSMSPCCERPLLAYAMTKRIGGVVWTQEGAPATSGKDLVAWLQDVGEGYRAI